MYRIATGSTGGLDDVQAFVESLNGLAGHTAESVRTIFAGQGEVIVARAPGRLDVMGGIADYSGSLVLQLPIGEATIAAVQKDPVRRLQIVSLRGPGGRSASVFEMPLSDLEFGGRPVAYESARQFFACRQTDHWAAYVAGAALVLMREKGASFPQGARILIRSDVPEGLGVSSSAALEVAVMQALSAAFDIRIEPLDMAILCQTVENLVVGAPCGLMDQVTAVFGLPGRLLSLLCQPAELQNPIAVPHNVRFWGIDSGIRHAVSGSDYRAVRTGAFMGYRIIAECADLRVRGPASDGTVRIEDPRWNGYLANIGPDVFEAQFESCVPEKMGGEAFLSDYGGISDPVTAVDPGVTYAVRTPTAHPVYENARVRRFAELLGAGSPTDDGMLQLGRLMGDSHESYSACGLGTGRTDRILEMVSELGPRSGLFGARITGGGSGGTVAVLGAPEGCAAIESIVQRYETETGHRPYVFSGSSPGAAEFGILRLTPTAA